MNTHTYLPLSNKVEMTRVLSAGNSKSISGKILVPVKCRYRTWFNIIPPFANIYSVQRH